MSNLAARLERDNLLTREWQLLENQRKVYAALSEVTAAPFDGDEWADSATDLKRKVAYEVFCTCRRLWDLSASEGNEVRGV